MAVTGSVLSVRFEGGLPAILAKKQVKSPHWQVDPVSGTQGTSTGPAIYPIQEPVRAVVDVELAGTGNTGAPATLRAQLGNLALAGPIPLTDGLHSVSVAGNPGTAITRHSGEVSWIVQGASLPAPVALANRTPLEVFVVLGKPPGFFSGGIWAEALRVLLRPEVRLDGVQDEAEAIHRITKYCHENHKVRYNTSGSNVSYGPTRTGGTFHLLGFLKVVRPEVNCFDLAAAVIVLAGAVGVAARWLLMPSFGYIAETNLVGVGPCNNPHSPTVPIITPRDHPDRTRFNDHGFCERDGTIFDACVGPHLGKDGHQVYLNTAVDPNNSKGLGIPSAGQIQPKENSIKNLA